MRWVPVVVFALACCGSGKREVIKLADEHASVEAIVADDLGVAWSTGHDLKTRSTDGTVRTIAHGDLFGLALDHDAIYWSDGKHLWRATRGATAGKPFAELDAASKLIVAAGYVYWAKATGVGRVAISTGANEIVAKPLDGGRTWAQLTIDGSSIIAVATGRGESEPEGAPFATEVWRLDGAAQRIGRSESFDEYFVPFANSLTSDGGRIYCERMAKAGSEIISLPIAGGPFAKAVDGVLVAASGGMLYVARAGGTFAIKQGSPDRRIGPRARAGVIAGKRLYAQFDDAIGVIELP